MGLRLLSVSVSLVGGLSSGLIYGKIILEQFWFTSGTHHSATIPGDTRPPNSSSVNVFVWGVLKYENSVNFNFKICEILRISGVVFVRRVFLFICFRQCPDKYPHAFVLQVLFIFSHLLKLLPFKDPRFM